MKRLPEKPQGGNLVGMCAQLMLSNSNKANQFMLLGAPLRVNQLSCNALRGRSRIPMNTRDITERKLFTTVHFNF